MLMDSLIFGCARLTGGASQGEALRLIRTALDAGITHVDTAPSYGMGTAEAVVGKALRAFGGDVAVTAKLGSARDPSGFAKSVLRRLKRTLGGSRSAPLLSGRAAPQRVDAPVGNDFSAPAMHASLAISQERLGRIDYLLLHDVTAEEVTPLLSAELQSLAEPLAAQTGYASLAQWDAALDGKFSGMVVAQSAIVPQWLVGGPQPEWRHPLFLHSIVNAGGHCRAAVEGFAEALDRAARMIDAGDQDAARIAALYALAGQVIPAAKFLVASSHCDRLQAVLAAVASIDRTGSAAEIAAEFATVRVQGQRPADQG
jgi:hypothetical protein